MDKEPIAHELGAHATEVVKNYQENSSLWLMELAAVFRIAAAICDEAHSTAERAKMASKFAGWRPGE